MGKEETFMDSIKREIAIMKKVNHPNVLRLYEVMDDPKVRRSQLWPSSGTKNVKLLPKYDNSYSYHGGA